MSAALRITATCIGFMVGAACVVAFTACGGSRPATGPTATSSAPTTTPTGLATATVPAGTPSPAAAADQFYSVDFISAEVGWAAGKAGIFATHDGGDHWLLQYRAQPEATGGEVDFLDAQTGFALAPAGLLTTTDGGQHWHAPPVPEGQPTYVDFVSATTGWAIGAKARGATEGTLFRIDNKEDSGEPYQMYVEVMSPAESICFGDERHGWVANGQEVKRTVDGGGTWTTSFTNPVQGTGPGWQPTLQCAGTDVAWVMYADGAALGNRSYVLFRTLDGGAHWEPVMHAPIGPVLGAHVGVGYYPGPFSVIDANDTFVVGACPMCPDGTGGTSSIEITHDGGTTWQPAREVTGAGAFARALEFVDTDHGWLATDSGIFATTDGGRTWTKQPSNADSSLRNAQGGPAVYAEALSTLQSFLNTWKQQGLYAAAAQFLVADDAQRIPPRQLR